MMEIMLKITIMGNGVQVKKRKRLRKNANIIANLTILISHYNLFN